MINRTIFSDNDILSWNDRLKDHQLNIIVKPKYTTDTAYNPCIGFDSYVINNTPTSSWGSPLYRDDLSVSEPHIKYNFIFSVLSSKNDEFNTIHNTIKLNKILNPILSNEKRRNSNPDDVSKTLSIETHNIFGKEYHRYNYAFEGKLGDIMGYVKLIEDSLNLVNITPKYKVSDVVSDAKDGSRDYMILKYVYSTTIDYLVSEVLSDSSDNIIRYGNTMLKHEDDLVWSRNSRIDEIISNNEK